MVTVSVIVLSDWFHELLSRWMMTYFATVAAIFHDGY